MVHIDLIAPIIDKEYKNLKNGYSIMPPASGLEILAHYVSSKLENIKIKVHQDISHSAVEFEGDLIGISDWFSNHKTAIDIARSVKQTKPSCKVILGGPNASNLRERILNNHPYIDYVVSGDGEETLVGIIEAVNGGKNLREVPNLWFRDENKKIKFTFDKNISLNEQPLFDFSHLVKSNLKHYDSRRPDYIIDFDRTPIPLSSIRGCIKASKYRKCSYCQIPTQGTRLMKPRMVWEQIKLLYEKYGVVEFFETGDDFIVGNYPEKLLKAKPEGLDVSFRIYTAPDKVSPEIARILKDLGVKEIFMGIENINSEILRKANKFYDVSKVEESVRNCEYEGIKLFLPFLFGLPGETDETAKKNHEFAHKIAGNHKNVNRILYSLAVPIIGSSWFDELASDETLQKQYPEILWQDMLDYTKLTELSLKKFCNVDIDQLLNLVNSPPSLPYQRIASYGDIAHKIMERKNGKIRN